jgi:filamentous hemagglutinin
VTFKSGIPAVDELQAIEPSAGEYISGGELNESSYAITDLTETERSLAATVASGADKTGGLTEELVDSVAERQGLQSLDGGKYGSNNGFDHVYMGDDGSVMILESKQLKGGFSLNAGSDDVV